MTKQVKSRQKKKIFINKKGQEVVRNEKGQVVSGTPNPFGRPIGAGISITTEIKRALETKPEGQKLTHLQLIVQRILKKAIVDGDSATIKQVWNYIDGMPKQSVQLEGEIGSYELSPERREQIERLFSEL